MNWIGRVTRRLGVGTWAEAGESAGAQVGTGLIATAFAGAVFGIIPFAWAADSLTVLASGLIVGAAAWICGGIVGFLFGIPRTPPSESVTEDGKPAPAPDFIANTNLVEISDWLTKIIVGLGLVHLAQIPEHLAQLQQNLVPAFGGGDAAGPFAVAVVVFYSADGFLFWYLLTRLQLQREFGEADRGRDLTEDERQLDSEAEAALQSSQGGDPDSALGELRELAKEYENIRATQPSGWDRTRNMGSVVSRMRRVSAPIAGDSEKLSPLCDSASPGERLAAVVALQVRPHADRLEWLSERFGAETPFCEYQAALALLTAAKQLPKADALLLRGALARAKNHVLGGLDTDRGKVLSEAENRLEDRRD